MSNAERLIIGVIGLMRGIIVLFLRRSICILLSMSVLWLFHDASRGLCSFRITGVQTIDEELLE